MIAIIMMTVLIALIVILTVGVFESGIVAFESNIADCVRAAAERTFWRNLILTVLSILVGLIFVRINFFIEIPTGHTGVVSTYGKISPDTIPEGLHPVWSFRTVVVVDLTRDEYTLNSEISRPEAHSAEGIGLVGAVSVPVSIDPDGAVAIVRAIGEKDVGEQIVIPALRAAMKSVMLWYPLSDILDGHISRISGEISTQLAENLVRTMTEYGASPELARKTFNVYGADVRLVGGVITSPRQLDHRH